MLSEMEKPQKLSAFEVEFGPAIAGLFKTAALSGRRNAQEQGRRRVKKLEEEDSKGEETAGCVPFGPLQKCPEIEITTT